VNLIALPTRLIRILPQPHRIAAHFGGHVEPDIASKLEPFGMGAAAQISIACSTVSRKAELDAFKLELAGLDLRENSRMSLMICSSAPSE